ncbi:hypothetical protein KAS08_03010 [Candidatus Pacearchaeota archaeon]|nr:hypothetical protein [Candidatus Pacearchaeota archaeon]
MEKEKLTFVLLFVIFVLTELVDDFFDHVLGNSIIHSILQLFLFLGLFFTAYKIFIGYHKKQISKLISEELLEILKTVKHSEEKGILINQIKITKLLKITKPTIKKRVGNLLELKYITFETKGNNKYLKLTPTGNSILR